GQGQHPACPPAEGAGSEPGVVHHPEAIGGTPDGVAGYPLRRAHSSSATGGGLDGGEPDHTGGASVRHGAPVSEPAAVVHIHAPGGEGGFFVAVLCSTGLAASGLRATASSLII